MTTGWANRFSALLGSDASKNSLENALEAVGETALNVASAEEAVDAEDAVELVDKLDFDATAPRAAPSSDVSHAETTVEDLASGIERMREYAAKQGRTEPLDVNFVPFGLSMNVRSLPPDDLLLEQLAALEAAGVTWVSLGLPTASRGSYLEALGHFSETFLSPRTI